MKELLQAIHHAGPVHRDERALLVALAVFADDDGVLRDWSIENLMWATGFPEITVNRRLNSLQRGGWLFSLRSTDGSSSVHVIEIKTLAMRTLASASRTSCLATWAEGILGVTPFPSPNCVREVRYK